MRRRLEFHEVLCNLISSRDVYFQPPASIQMHFPCIIYSLNRIGMEYADNFLYHGRDGYTVIYVDRNPDSPIPDKIGELELSSFDRHYNADGLHHFVYSVYY